MKTLLKTLSKILWKIIVQLHYFLKLMIIKKIK